MRRDTLPLDRIADLHNLASAFHAAASGKRGRPDLEQFRDRLDDSLADLRRDILAGTVRVGEARSFRIRDPKPRQIHAPVFRERVLHHAIMAHAGPVLDRSLIFDTYACRLGKGSLAAVRRVKAHAGQFAWFTQIDIDGYFAHIDHEVLLSLLARTFRDRDLLALFGRIVAAHRAAHGRGLPIGALTSQHFANFYLAAVDRLIMEDPRVRGMVRYMDDLIWWTDDRAQGQAVLADVRAYLRDRLKLTIKKPPREGPSRHGVVFCGFRIQCNRLLLTRRRKRRYQQLRRAAETAWSREEIDGLGLQAAYAPALALTVHADALSWRREELRRHPPALALDDA